MRILRLMAVLPGVMLLSRPAAAQQREVTGLSMNGVPHPVSAALAYWDTLHLSEAQVLGLRRVAARIGQLMGAEYERQVADTSSLLRFWRPGPVDSAALVAKAHGDVDRGTHFMLELLRARDTTFRILLPWQRARLDSLVVGRMRRPAKDFRMDCASGGIGGSMALSDSATLVFSLRFEGDSARIAGIAIARPDSAALPSIPTLASRNFVEPRGGGASVGRWSIQADSIATWIDSTRIDRKGRNVVLLQGVDRVTRMPDVVGLVEVPTYFRTGGCRDTSYTDLLRAHVLASPEVRAFLEGRFRSP